MNTAISNISIEYFQVILKLSFLCAWKYTKEQYVYYTVCFRENENIKD